MPYSLENLKTLMAQSEAYRDLPADQKAKIEQMIQSNDKPGLIYVYSKLKEEQDSYQASRLQLGNKLDQQLNTKIQINKQDTSSLLG